MYTLGGMKSLKAKHQPVSPYITSYELRLLSSQVSQLDHLCCMQGNINLQFSVYT